MILMHCRNYSRSVFPQDRFAGGTLLAAFESGLLTRIFKQPNRSGFVGRTDRCNPVSGARDRLFDALQVLIDLGPKSVRAALVPVSVACEPSLWPGLHRAPGKRISGVRDEGAPIRFRTVFVSCRDRERAITPAQTAENRGCSAETGNSGLAQDCVVDPAGLEPATRSL